jgi:hypothetical protein
MLEFGMTIKKIFEGDVDDSVRNDFIKFGRGEFENKYLIEAKKQKDKFAIKTSAEFANFFVRKCLEKVSGIVQIKGVIISTMDLSEEVSFEIKKKSNFQGIRKIEIDTEISPEKILELMNKYPKIFFGLSFKTSDFDVKIKPKAPKSAKPGKDGQAKADFCTLKTNDKSILDEILFDVEDFKEVKINHTIKIDEIIYPKEAGLSPAEIREKSKRKGVLIRKRDIDGVLSEKSVEFEI